MTRQYDLDISTADFEIKIDTATNYGYFEHNELGDECGGGLWFQDGALTDYDGVYELPKQVETALRANFNTDYLD